MSVQDYMNLPYDFVIKQITDESGTYFHAIVLELDGCQSTGETFQEVYEGIREAMESWIEAKLENGFTVPMSLDTGSYSGKFVVRLPKSLHCRLVMEAECDGIANIKIDWPISVTIDKSAKQIVFKPSFSNLPNANLQFEKITNVAWITEENVKNASVVGNAIVGGVLFGGLGAVVGAVSGTNKKSQTYLVINYTSTEGDLKAISIKENGNLKS